MLPFFTLKGKAMKTKRFKSERLGEGMLVIAKLLNPIRIGETRLYTGKIGNVLF